jgi:hypothetical protein
LISMSPIREWRAAFAWVNILFKFKYMLT